MHTESAMTTLTFASWNVNSLKVRLAHVVDWLERSGADALALQETKLVDSAFPRDAFAEAGLRIICRLFCTANAAKTIRKGVFFYLYFIANRTNAHVCAVFARKPNTEIMSRRRRLFRLAVAAGALQQSDASLRARCFRQLYAQQGMRLRGGTFAAFHAHHIMRNVIMHHHHMVRAPAASRRHSEQNKAEKEAKSSSKPSGKHRRFSFCIKY